MKGINTLKLLVTLSFLVVCVSPGLAAVVVKHPIVRPMRAGMTQTGAFMTIMNETNERKTLMSIKSPVAKFCEVHRMSTDDRGVMHMEKVEPLVLDPQQSLELKPGSYHLMLFGVQKTITSGSKVEIFLHFSGEPVIKLQAVAK